MDDNVFEQLSALRRHYLPTEKDSEESFARAVWLDNRHWENMRVSVSSGIALAFKGE